MNLDQSRGHSESFQQHGPLELKNCTKSVGTKNEWSIGDLSMRISKYGKYRAKIIIITTIYLNENY
jgi:hypothetical protein